MQRRVCSSYTFCHARLKLCDKPALLRVTRYFLIFSPLYRVFPHTVSVVANTTSTISNAF